MKIKDYPFEEGQPARLRIRYDGTAARIFFDGEEAAVLSMPQLRKGWSRQLEDGSLLEVKTLRPALFPELAILRDGKHIESSPSHPERVLLRSSNTMLFVVAVIIVSMLRRGAFEWLVAGFAVLYSIGAWLLREGRRLGAAFILFPVFIELDLIAFSAITGTLVGRWWIYRVIADVLFTFFGIRAYKAANELWREKAAAA